MASLVTHPLAEIFNEELLARELSPSLFAPFTLGLMRKKSEDSMHSFRVDLEENEQSYLLRAELPGIKKEEINISIDENTVTIRAEKKSEVTANKEEKANQQINFLYRERQHGTFMRSFSLPNTVDSASANAKYENGVLLLTLPKQTISTTRQITIE